MPSTAVVVPAARCGTLFLVVGPSGAGKDSLIRSAQSALADRPSFHFPRRVVTRPADPASEDFESVTPAEFERRRAAGDFCLHWTAHGLLYGVPDSVRLALKAGQSAVVNVSRTVIADAAGRFPCVRVVEVTAPDAVLDRRLAARGRESDGDLESRRKRQVRIEIDANIGLATIVNDRSLEEASNAFIGILLERFEIEATQI